MKNITKAGAMKNGKIIVITVNIPIATLIGFVVFIFVLRSVMYLAVGLSFQSIDEIVARYQLFDN
jgi:hypothetical protein